MVTPVLFSWSYFLTNFHFDFPAVSKKDFSVLILYLFIFIYYIYFRYKKANQRSLRMFRKEKEDIQNSVSDEEKKESSQHSTDVIRPTPQQQTPQNRQSRPAVKRKDEQNISKNWADDIIEIL